MAAARLNQDSGARRQRVNFAVHFDVAFAFENVIKLCHSLVIVKFAILFDFNEMHRGNRVFIIHESAPRLLTRARGGIQICKI